MHKFHCFCFLFFVFFFVLLHKCVWMACIVWRVWNIRGICNRDKVCPNICRRISFLLVVGFSFSFSEWITMYSFYESTHFNLCVYFFGFVIVPIWNKVKDVFENTVFKERNRNVDGIEVNFCMQISCNGSMYNACVLCTNVTEKRFWLIQPI